MPTNSDATLAVEAVGMRVVEMPPQIGEWLVQRRLGAGAMGEVFLAQRGSQRAALKLLARRFASDDGFIQRFKREFSVLTRLDHANVARALDGGEHDRRPWLAMELINGPDLQSLLDAHGPFFESDVLGVAVQIARGIEHMHRQAGLIHRDVKPANVLMARAPGGDPNRLLNPGDVAKLIDFGLARPIEQDEGSGLTVAGTIIGTPSYIAPEQISCDVKLTLHVDMYSLGASIFHLLTGHTPFERGSSAAVMAAHLNDAIPDPGQLVPAISPATRALVMKAMAKRPADRHPDWAAFIAAAEAALAGLGSADAPRLLKKPLTRPPTTTAYKASESDAAQKSGSDAAKKTGSDAYKPASGVHPAGANALRAAVQSTRHPRTDAIAAPTGEQALRQAVSSSITKPPTAGARRPTTRRQVANSAVSRISDQLDPPGTTGGSILPWLVLGVAGLLAIAGAIWALSS